MRFKAAIIAITCSIIVSTSALGGAIPDVQTANARTGHPDNLVSSGFALTKIAEGSDVLENPSGVITTLGYLNDFPPQAIERTKTEPDENTYVVFNESPGGPTPGYDYGRRFLYQGHENGNDLAYCTRINMDVTDPAHRITLLTPLGPDGKTGFGSIDGSAWNPFTKSVLFTQERGFPGGGVIEVSREWPPVVRTLNGIIGSSGYEGIHPDKNGNLLICEDAGGTTVNVVRGDTASPKTARQPNSFVYLFVPGDKTDLSKGGRLLALQVLIDRQPVVFNASDPVGDVFTDSQLKLHTPGTIWPCRWVTVHDTDTDGFAPFNSNALAKGAGATPFKRPENAQFLPGSGFTTFFFDATGDTDANSGNQPDLAARGAWGALFRVDLVAPNLEGGLISIFALGDKEHAAFDNLSFVDSKTLLVAEDRGEGLHTQLNTFDSVWAYSVRGGADSAERVVRFIALGRDSESEIDAGLAGTSGFQNDTDNEPTGLHVSDGASSIKGLVGQKVNKSEARWFITQQHGRNQIFQIIRTN